MRMQFASLVVSVGLAGVWGCSSEEPSHEPEGSADAVSSRGGVSADISETRPQGTSKCVLDLSLPVIDAKSAAANDKIVGALPTAEMISQRFCANADSAVVEGSYTVHVNQSGVLSLSIAITAETIVNKVKSTRREVRGFNFALDTGKTLLVADVLKDRDTSATSSLHNVCRFWATDTQYVQSQFEGYSAQASAANLICIEVLTGAQFFTIEKNGLRLLVGTESNLIPWIRLDGNVSDLVNAAL